jgi:hypothetical protein
MILVILNTSATAADIYNPSTHQLTMPLVAIGNATYSNMMVTPANILCAQGGRPNGNEDTYYFNDNQLFIPSVTVQGSPYSNVLTTVGSLISIGSVTGADTYNGVDLIIPAVQVVGGAIYYDVTIAVGNIVSAGGGMPANVVDAYNPANKELTIAAVQVGSKVYTNAIVTVGKILSVTGSQPAKPNSHPASGSAGTCDTTPLDLLVAALPGGANGGLIVPVGGVGNIAIIAVNQSSQDLSSIIVSATTGAAKLPLTITMCQTTAAVGDCSTAPATTLAIPLIAPASPPNNANSPQIQLQVTASAAIASDPANQILISFTSGSGTVVGSVSVPVSASVLPVGVFAATASGNGVVNVPVGTQAAFAVAADNQSATSETAINVTTSTNVPVLVTLCQTNPNSGACLEAPSASVSLASLAANANVTFSVFVSAPTAIPNDPAANLIFVNFEKSDGTVVGSTSVGVTTN